MSKEGEPKISSETRKKKGNVGLLMATIAIGNYFNKICKIENFNPLSNPKVIDSNSTNNRKEERIISRRVNSIIKHHNRGRSF